MNPSLLWLAASLFIWGIGEGMFYIFQPIYLSQLGADPVQIGYILGAAGFAMLIAHIPAGYIADRVGRRPLLITAWSFGVLSTGLMALAPGLPMFVAGLVLYGFTAFVSAPLNSYVTAARGPWTVGRAITLISAVYNAGVVLGPFTGGWLGDHFGLRTVYFVAAGLFIISTLLLLFIAPQPRDHHGPEGGPTSLLTNRRYLSFLGLGFVVTFAMYLAQPFTSKFLQDVRHLAFSEIGLLGTVGGAGNTLLSFLLGSLNTRLGFLLGQAGVGMFTLLLWQSSGYGWFALAYFLLGGFRAARSLYTAQIRPLVRDSQMGLAYGIAESVASLAIILAPVLAGFLYERNPASVYPAAFVAILLGILLSLFFAPKTPANLPPTIEFPE